MRSAKWKKRDAILRFVLFVFFVVTLQGCASSPQIGFQPAGHDNEFKVAEAMRIGDDAGRDVDKSTHTTQTTSIWAKAVTYIASPSARAAAACIGLPLLFAFAIFAADRWMTYRRLATIQAESIHVQESGGRTALSLIRPRIRRLGARRKRLFDNLLETHGCLIRTAPNTND